MATIFASFCRLKDCADYLTVNFT